jgi:two-component system OmpR family response regulator
MPDHGRRVLVVDGEPGVTDLIALALRDDGFTIEKAGSGRAALVAIARFNPDLVILEVTLPDLSGLDVLRRLSAESRRPPVIFLTARGATEDKVNGLAVGADDYVTKPFSVAELVARVRVVLRRHAGAAADDVLRTADLELDQGTHEVRRGGELIELTHTEYRMLRYLLVNAGRVVTRSQILDQLWSQDFEGHIHVIETYISYLRRKVDRFDPPLIRTVRGLGYVIRPPGVSS